jgi:hypothetical protein
MKRTRTDPTSPSRSRDLSKGVIVVLSGGPVDITNPPEVRNRMDQLIFQVNHDPFVLANTNDQGLTFKLIPHQEFNHIHQSMWPQICDSLKLPTASPLILIGHSNGGAAVIDLARCLENQGTSVDLAFTADSVLTLNDNGDANKIPSNIKLNLNSHVIPTPAWFLGPFFFGQQNHRDSDGSFDGILNIGLPFDQPGWLAHRNAFYDLAGGDELPGRFQFPEMLLEVTLDVLRGESSDEIFQAAQKDLQVLANEARIRIELETANFKATLEPAGIALDAAATSRLPHSAVDDLRTLMSKVEMQRLRAL